MEVKFDFYNDFLHSNENKCYDKNTVSSKRIIEYNKLENGFEYCAHISKNESLPILKYGDLINCFNSNEIIKQLIIKNFTVGDVLMKIITEKCKNIEKLCLINCENITEEGISALFLNCKMITYLDISYSKLDEKCFNIILSLPNLKTLFVIQPADEVTFESLKIIENSIENVYFNLTNLIDPQNALKNFIFAYEETLLNLRVVVSSFHMIDWISIFSNCKKLKSLILTFDSFEQDSLEFVGLLKNLELLIIMEYAKNKNVSVLNDESMIKVFRGCNNIISLALVCSGISYLTDHSMSQLATFCPEIKQVRLWNLDFFTDLSLINLSCLKQIKVLHLDKMKNISDIGVTTFVTKSKETFRKLRVKNCPNVTKIIIPTMIIAAENKPDENFNVYFDEVLEDEIFPSNFKYSFC